MSKAFWEGFIDGFLKAIPYGLCFYAGGMFVLFLEYIDPNPYMQCRTQYSDPTDIMECIWILENP